MSAEDKVKDLMAALEESVARAKEARKGRLSMRHPSEQYIPPAADDGEAAIRREREACEAEEIERTELAARAFKEKMRRWREEGGIPGYVGPRAGRDS